ncbi:MAG: hypothetical protein K8F91_05305, partial [Candidatus Obscuribacterales bacterium]|nr:hypothetical protein [Candidatus Obscuribacterales bacterium]
MVLDGLINIMIIILILISFLEIMGLKNIRSSLYGFEALFHVLLSRFAEAESACSRGIAICPHLGYNYKLRAYSRIRLENPQGAVEDCTAELGLKENDAGVLALRAWANYQVGDFDLVVRDLEKAMKLEPGRRFYYVDCLRLIDAYQNLEQDKNVVAFCTSVIKPRMDRTLMEELLIRRALAFVKLSQTDKAINDCTSAIGIAHPECLNDLLELRGQLYESEGKSQLAENDRSMAQAIRSKEARMSEWVPAGAVKRLSAHCVDALVVGSIVCALLSTISILVSAGATESKFYFLLSTYTILSAMPYLFLVSVLDSLFVFPSLFALLFLLPASILYCVPEITTGSDYVSAVIQGISDPVIRIFVVV